jgi:hypothetical protein
VDTTLAWTIVGSAAGVVGVVVATVAIVRQARSERRVGSKVTAELGIGQLAQDGVLYVEFMTGKTNVMTLPKPGKARASKKGGTAKRVQGNMKVSPVNAIFIRNEGGTSVKVSRCHYLSDLGGVGFRFEPQPAASARGDHLPKPLGPGEDAVLVHDLVGMQAFLNGVLLDHEMDAATFTAVLTLGNGREIVVPPSIRVHVDMSPQELAVSGFKLVRQEMGAPSTSVGWTVPGKRRRSRRTGHERPGSPPA